MRCLIGLLLSVLVVGTLFQPCVDAKDDLAATEHHASYCLFGSSERGPSSHLAASVREAQDDFSQPLKLVDFCCSLHSRLQDQLLVVVWDPLGSRSAASQWDAPHLAALRTIIQLT